MLEQPTISLGSVTLNVKDMEKEQAFYEAVLGLQVLTASDQLIQLGIEANQTVLVQLQPAQSERQAAYGLYHFAILMPSREALGDIFQHFLQQEVDLIGASNHGYSEAIYLEDPEGNGIEIYRDRPVSDWDIRGDEIYGITEAMDAQGVYESRTIRPYNGTYVMPVGTKMGHFHLSTSDSEASAQFYMQLFDMGMRLKAPTAAFIAAGLYHHHVAFNEWSGHHLASNMIGKQGLAQLHFVADNAVIFARIKENARKMGAKVVNESDDLLEVIDLDGTTVLVTLAV